ncbi:MAG: phosphoribosylglycinamide formyltransferase [Hyphococcus sp.]|nr:MAG: phosphoribosylglycinamide formyltransferase [Marinicaulis sp.]
MAAKLAVLISGRGTNLQSIIDAVAKEDFPAEITLVISNRPKAAGLDRAAKAGIPQQVIDHKDFKTREDFDAALDETLRMAEVDYVCLAGFMRLLTPDFVNDWRGRLINIHPSLLPAFRGLHVQERTIDAGVKVAGCSVHFVSAEVDAGPIIGQAAIPVLPGENVESLTARILEQEHRLYPACIKLVVEGKARISGALVQFDSSVVTEGALLNPPALAD